MGPPSYMRSVVDRNVVMRRITLVMCNMRFVEIGGVRVKSSNVKLSLSSQSFDDATYC